jgi:hypothetical protein
VQHDESGATISDSTVTYTILDTSATYAGTTSVVRVASADDTVAFRYISNGIAVHRPRIDIFAGVALPEVWITVDTTHTQPQTLYIQRDTVDFSGTTLYFYSNAEKLAMTDTVVTIDGKSYTAFRWKTVSSVSVTVPITGQTTTTTVEDTRAFAPKLGFLVTDQVVVAGATPQSPVENGTTTLSLTSSAIK